VRIQVLTIFPELFGPFLSTSLVGKAIAAGRLEVVVHDLRDHTTDRHRTVDDVPYGGGGGMVMTAPVWLRAIAEVAARPPRVAAAAGEDDGPPATAAAEPSPEGEAGCEEAAAGRGAAPWRVLLSPQGRRLDDALVRELAARRDLLLLCGRYEGIDERVRALAVDEEVSIGDFVVSGGELPAMVVIEAVSRQIPGVVKLAESVAEDSFRHGLLDYPHYTRPPEVAGLTVPAVLLSGNHAEIARWRRREALLATARKRPDLLRGRALSREERKWLAELAPPGGGEGGNEGEGTGTLR
jgi:tRNA (guanine37-N1)-methyltransferase